MDRHGKECLMSVRGERILFHAIETAGPKHYCPSKTGIKLGASIITTRSVKSNKIKHK